MRASGFTTSAGTWKRRLRKSVTPGVSALPPQTRTRLIEPASPAVRRYACARSSAVAMPSHDCSITGVTSSPGPDSPRTAAAASAWLRLNLRCTASVNVLPPTCRSFVKYGTPACTMLMFVISEPTLRIATTSSGARS